MEKSQGFFAKLKKKITVKKIIVWIVVLTIVITGAVYIKGKISPVSGTIMQSMGTRTTTLKKTTLSDSVTVTGTVESQDTVNVTTTLTGYKVSEILVQEGDSVTKGQVIARLDTTDLSENITKTKEKLSESAQTAQENYDKALSAMNTAEDKALAQETAYYGAKSTANAAASNFNAAVQAVSLEQNDYNAAAATEESHNKIMNACRADMNNALTAYINAQSAAQSAQSAYDSAVSAGEEQSVIDSKYQALVNAQGEESAKQQAYNTALSAYNTSASDYANAQSNTQQKLQALNNAKAACNYTALEKTNNDAQTALTQARSTLDSLEKNYENAQSSFNSAKKTLENSQTSDELEELYEKYNNCTIKATATGTITTVNATVGAVPNGAIAVIQDTENLKVSVSFQEYDVQNISKGMKCNITSDANDNTLSGYVSQISPTASSSMNSSDVSFPGEITIDGTDSGLLIGMNAKAEVLITQLSDIYVVPYDAVGTNDKGEKVVYVQNGDTFEEMTVTTGMETTYYIQIISDSLKEGMVIRSSANEDESEAAGFTEDGETSSNAVGGFNLSGITGGSGGGPSGGNGGNMGGGTLPSRG